MLMELLKAVTTPMTGKDKMAISMTTTAGLMMMIILKNRCASTRESLVRW